MRRDYEKVFFVHETKTNKGRCGQKLNEVPCVECSAYICVRNRDRENLSEEKQKKNPTNGRARWRLVFGQWIRS